ncbi:PEP-CTERM sorting domain-containing protein [Nitrospira sp. M1]
MKHRMGRWAGKVKIAQLFTEKRHSGDGGIVLLHQRVGRHALATLAGCMLLLASVGVDAASVGFTDRIAFQSALSGPETVVNFDNVSAGTEIQEGVPFQGMTFTSNVDNVLGRSGLIVSAEFFTTSPLNYLGVNDQFSNEFLFGDELNVNFQNPVQAVGLSIIGSPMATQANDFLLTAGGGSVFNAGTPEETLIDGGEVFFLGLISDQTFNSAQLISFGDQLDTSLGFNIDDISTVTPSNAAPVPEPSAALLLGTGLLMLGGIARWKKCESPAMKKTV